MAYSAAQMYPGATTPDSDFIDEIFKNSTAPGVYDGTPLNNLLFNQNLAWHDAMMTKAGLSYNNSADIPDTSQLFEAMQLSVEAENRFKDNQNPVTEGSTGDPLPSSTPTDYVVGSEPADGYEIVTTNATDVVYDAGVWTGTAGIIRRRYPQDAAGLITKDNQYGGVKLPDGTQLQALVDDIATNGVRITEDAGDICVDVDFGTLTGGFRFIGLSSERGRWAGVNDESSDFATKEYVDGLAIGVGQTWQDVTASRASGVTYTNTTGRPIFVSVITTSSSELARIGLYVDGLRVVYIGGDQDTGGARVQAGAIVPNGSTYYADIDSALSSWVELR